VTIYVWQESYKAALLETDDKKLSDRLMTSQTAIDKRLHEMNEEMETDHGSMSEERKAIKDALAGLQALRREMKRRAQDPNNA
jgi:hypothetical protein